MNASLRVRLDEVTERWGVKVTTVEVREVNPPAGVLEAMTRQMSAERTRRAAITEAEGQKQAAHHPRRGHQAGGDPRRRRRAAVRHPPGRGARRRAGEDPRGRPALDENTMQLQYLETLKQVGSSPSTKLVVPMDLLGGAAERVGRLQPTAATSSAGPAPAEGDRVVKAGSVPTPSRRAEDGGDARP